VLPAVCAAIWALTGGVAPAQAVTQTFFYTGGEQTFDVPGGVTTVHVVAIGGHGGAATDAVGGLAGEVIGDVSVTPGQTLYIEVGGRGEDIGEGGEGGFNGGGNGAGGGGGASDIRTLPLASGLASDTRLIVAAGGGGGGGSGPSGAGGNGGNAGEQGGSSEGYEGGGAGEASEGGAGAFGCEPSGEGGDGIRGEGGDGGDSAVESDPGGGGGSGYFGGGGGGGACVVGSSGGGGGSSLVPPEGTAGLASALAAPKIEITYTPVPPSISITSPTNGATYTQGQAVTAIYSCTPPEGTGVKTCAGPVANGAPVDTASLGLHTFTVEAEDTDGFGASKSVKYTVVATTPTTPPTTPPTTTPTTTPPDTFLGAHPKKVVKTKKAKAKVKFGFSSTAAGSTFQCKLDKGAFVPCTSPKTYKVKPGKHKFSVKATKGGVADPTPATFAFKVIKTQ
jgi:glycine rich protein